MARVCPYCGQAIDHGEQARESAPRGPQGVFRGRTGESSASESRAGKAKEPSIFRIARFFLDPRIDPVRKGAVIAALLYVLSPDLVPFFWAPLVGWVDDVLVLGLAWRLIDRALKKIE